MEGLDLPVKKYYSIGEVSKFFKLNPHVLRYWEQEFEQINPVKRRGNRRSYQQKDIKIIKNITELLYEQGYTIAGAKKVIAGLVKDVELGGHKAHPDSERLVSLSPQVDGKHNHIVIQQLNEVLAVLEN